MAEFYETSVRAGPQNVAATSFYIYIEAVARLSLCLEIFDSAVNGKRQFLFLLLQSVLINKELQAVHLLQQ